MELIKFSFIILALLIVSCRSNKSEHINENIIEDSKNPKLDIRYSENLETLALIYKLSASGDFCIFRSKWATYSGPNWAADAGVKWTRDFVGPWQKILIFENKVVDL